MGHYHNHPSLPTVFFTFVTYRSTNKAFIFSMQPLMLCWSLVLLLFAQNSDAQPGYLTVEPSQQAVTVVDSKKPVKAIGPEIFTTSSLPAASPAGMVTSITDLAIQEQDTFDNKLAISTSQSFPEQFQQSYSQPRTKQAISFSKVSSPQYLSKSRANSLNVRPQGSLPTFPEEEEKIFPELLPVVTLVEKLQSQVLDLQRMRLEDR